MLVIKMLILNSLNKSNPNIHNNNLINLNHKIWNMIKNINMMNKNTYHNRNNIKNKIDSKISMIYMSMISQIKN